MTFTASGGFGKTFKDIIGNVTAAAWPGSASDFKVALFTNSLTTPDYNAVTAYGAAPFNANEIPNGSGYTTGGKVLVNLTASTPTGTVVTFDADDLAWTSATFSGVRGGLIYDDVITTPTADPGFVGVTFGNDFAVTAGTFTIQWNASGIWTLDFA